MTNVLFICLFWDLSKWHLAFLAPLWVLKAISQTLPSISESCLDLLVPVVGLPGAPMPICACNLHATCFNIFLIARLGLGASCWFLLGVICLCGAWSVYLRPCALYCTALTCLNA